MKILIDDDLLLELQFGSEEYQKIIGHPYAMIVNMGFTNRQRVTNWFKERLPNVQISGTLIFFQDKNDEIYLKMFAV